MIGKNLLIFYLNMINSKTSKKKFIITFDDGYEDIFLNALPILKKYNFFSVKL